MGPRSCLGVFGLRRSLPACDATRLEVATEHLTIKYAHLYTTCKDGNLTFLKPSVQIGIHGGSLSRRAAGPVGDRPNVRRRLPPDRGHGVPQADSPHTAS